MLKARGKIHVDKKNNRIVVDVTNDFVGLYYWFISKHYWIKMNTPMHGAHITIYNNVVNKHNINWNEAIKYNRKSVEFEYDERIIEGGYHKGIIMYYIKVFSKEIERIKQEIEVIDGPKYRGLHITIANSKSDTIKPDWPQMIKIGN